jgi:uncharacterized protein
MHNFVMPKKLLRRYLPDSRTIRESRALRPVRRWLHEPDLWHLNRRSVSGAVFIGLFCAFLPIPFQMLPAALLALAARCNLPLSIALVWVSNPLTMGPMVYFAYRLGAWLLDRRIEVASIHLSWEWLGAHIGDIGWPLLVGSLVSGWVVGLTGLVVVRVTWRLHVISRWRVRLEKRRLRKLLANEDLGGSG